MAGILTSSSSKIFLISALFFLPNSPSFSQLPAENSKVILNSGNLLSEERELFAQELTALAINHHIKDTSGKNRWPSRLYELAQILSPNNIIVKSAKTKLLTRQSLDGFIPKHTPEVLSDMLQERGRRLLLSKNTQDIALGIRFAQISAYLNPRSASAKQFSRLSETFSIPIKWIDSIQ